MSEEKYRVVEKIGPGMQMVMAKGTLLGCKQFLIEQIDKDYTRIMNIEPNPFYGPKLRPHQQKAIDDLKEELLKSGDSGEWKFHSWINVSVPEPPQLIQGYTAEQWQEIIDGGYLCEAKDVSSRKWVPVILKKVDNDDEDHPFKIKYSASSAVEDDEDHDWQKYCRPAQIKGVMRPIFVEPVDKEAMCMFFNERGDSINKKAFGFAAWNTEMKTSGATKYIEL